MIDGLLTAIIGDDERPARAELALLLESHAEVTCSGQAASVTTADAATTAQRIDNAPSSKRA